ncbi:ddt domain containing protein [Niveomyces insectorum RCEF 264]|uniref:Ddt domain containing protein n=1 Tax=Niveomyces insectorum RCEF 264 TaxID=1081102 RepID=A0A168A1D1_9HYPO|nr:ddt domain containing protein [Niveomyces insectorum RCEF 264]
MEFYKQRRFNCQITGHSNLNFFEALESERTGAAEVEQAFPEALKGPVLRRIQFQIVSRIDTLVDQIYNEFKADYHPGEAVTVVLFDGERQHGVVRDKTRYGSKVLPDGTLTPPYTRYIVSLDGPRDGEEAVVEESNIFRDRKVFTKSVLRSFIKKTVAREAWNGAPWLVKNEVAEQYHIDTRVPSNLLYNNKMLERKQVLAQKRQSQQSNDLNSLLNSSPSSPETQPLGGGGLRLPELKPVPKSHKAKHLQLAQQQRQQQQQELQHMPHQQENGAPAARTNGFSHHAEPGQFQHLPLPNNPFQFSLSMRNHAPTPPTYVVSDSFARAPPVQLQPPPPPAPKYPIEDLQLEPSKATRPALKFLCNDPPVASDDKLFSSFSDKIWMKSVGPLLETWDTLNVYCEIFKLDSFTFDDFLEALVYASDDTPVQLFDEIHCAVLKTLVQAEAEGGEVQVQLPELDEEDDEEEDDEEGENEEQNGDENEPEPESEAESESKPPARATRSRIAKLEAERLAAEAAAADKEKEEEEPVVVHHAEDVLADYDWIDQLRKRQFGEGGWQMMMVGLLYQLSKDERRKASCEELLAQIVPPTVEATKDTVQQHYSALDINYRVQALQIICMLTVQTKAVRGYMEDCSEQMTKYRKEKIEWQRARKQAVEELKILNDQRKILLPSNMPPSPPQEPTKPDMDVKMSDIDDLSPAVEDEDGADTEDEGVSTIHARGRSLRRAGDRAAERKRKREAEAAAKVPKQSKQFLKLLRDIEKKEDEIRNCENEIATLDNDLREADCPRTRVLGKDRFWNRYYWFERNGMPYGGLPTSSTANADYANGCIWVQGPDELERVGYIDMAPEYQKEYKAKFSMTVAERKKQEEGRTSLVNANQWGYFSEPEELDELIGWLDPRGFNEMKLRKELVTFRSKIAANMENRKKYVSPPDSNGEAKDKSKEKDKDKDKDTANHSSAGTTKRMSMRMRTAPTPEPAPSLVLRCRQWTNSMAIEDLGHLHSEQPPPARVRKHGRKKEVAAEAAEPPRKKAMTRQSAK